MKGADVGQKGFCLFPFDFTPNLCGHKPHWCVQEQDSFRLEIGTSTSLIEVVTLVVYDEFREVLEIDRKRECSFELARSL
jgi:hypothetical protein